MTKKTTPESFLQDLEDQIKEHFDYQSQSEQDIARLESEISLLERGRDEAFNEVALDHSNKDAHNDLDQKDNQIAELKKELTNIKRKYRRKYRSQRSKILQTQDNVLETIQTELRSKQERQHVLRNVEIPEAEQNLSALQHENETIQDEMQALQKASEMVNRLSIDEEI
jgi:ABC-type molybdate transport system ATPase subunit